MVSPKEIEKIEENWAKLVGLVEKISNETVRTSLLELCSEIKDRMAVTPASTKTEYHGAFPGGLVDTALKTVKLMNQLNKAYDAGISTDSIILCGLFANVGKIGTEMDDLYTEQESNWHRERGMMYEWNKKLGVVPPPVRSLWWLTSSGVQLSEDEIYAISSLATMGEVSQNSNELFGAPLLAVILQNATRVVSIQGSGGSSVLD